MIQCDDDDDDEDDEDDEASDADADDEEEDVLQRCRQQQCLRWIDITTIICAGE